MSKTQTSPNPRQPSGRRGRPPKRATSSDAWQEVRAESCTSTEPSRDSAGTGRLANLVHLVKLASSGSNRPVDARWQIAAVVVNEVASRYFFGRMYDEDAARAVKYLKALKACHHDADRDRLGEAMPHTAS